MPKYIPELIQLEKSLPFCGCGCGKTVSKYGNRFISGHNPNKGGMLGKHHSEEIKEKMRLLHIGKHPSNETRRKMSESKKGDRNPAKRPEVRARISKNLKGRKPAFLGRYHSKLSRRKISKALIGHIPWNKGIPRTIQERCKISAAKIGHYLSDETKSRMKIASKRRWQDPEYAKRQLKAIFAGSAISPNRPERTIKRILNRLFPGEYKFVGDGSFLIGYKNPDFVNINGQKKLVELFGDYWHSKKVTGLKKKEHRKQRQNHFAKYGYQTCVVWQRELKHRQKLIQKLQEFHHNA